MLGFFGSSFSTLNWITFAPVEISIGRGGKRHGTCAAICNALAGNGNARCHFSMPPAHTHTHKREREREEAGHTNEALNNWRHKFALAHTKKKFLLLPASGLSALDFRWIFSPIFPASPIHFLFLCILHCSLPGSMFNSQSRAQLGDLATFALQRAPPPLATSCRIPSSVTLGRSRFSSSSSKSSSGGELLV